MNSDNLIQLLQTGFRVTLGATTSFIETLQDPQKREQGFAKLSTEFSELSQSLQDAQRREQNLAKWRTELTQLTEEWAEKGAVTEQEARSFVETVLAQNNGHSASSTTTSSYTTATPVAPPDVQLELQELTAQIAAIRAELEKLRNPESSN